MKKVCIPTAETLRRHPEPEKFEVGALEENRMLCYPLCGRGWKILAICLDLPTAITRLAAFPFCSLTSNYGSGFLEAGTRSRHRRSTV